ncbi:translation initiation factor IF-5A [Candidatus Micrarchaeota archaeon]|nr:MAG: translation initiation factor IF-5A [Candidatus Micrarchaeota archaeon]
MEVERKELKELKPGKLVVIDGEPCRVVDISISKPGKHGEAKARVSAVSLFSGKKKNILGPGDMRVDVPILIRKTAQVIALMGDRAQLMDMESYETYEEDIPEDMKGKLEAGQEVEVWEILGRRLISRVR